MRIWKNTSFSPRKPDKKPEKDQTRGQGLVRFTGEGKDQKILSEGEKMDKKIKHVPKFVWIVLIVLGCIDLIRGFMHTVALEYAALNIAGLDLTTSTATEQLRLLGTFGISNWITGVTFILIGLKAKHLSIYIMGLIPAAYGLSIIAMRINMTGYGETSANWGGISLMIPYLMVAAITFIAGISVMAAGNKTVRE